jgi:hypothetical protein
LSAGTFNWTVGDDLTTADANRLMAGRKP